MRAYFAENVEVWLENYPTLSSKALWTFIINQCWLLNSIILVYNHTHTHVFWGRIATKYSWISSRCQVGCTLASGLSMSDFNSESRFGILMKNYTDIFQTFFRKTRTQFSDLFVSALCCNWFIFIFGVLHEPWWRRRRFLASRFPMVANEDVLESPEPPASCATMANTSRGH